MIDHNFVGFAPLEDEDVLLVDGQLPYYFTKDGDTFTVTEFSNLNVGVYQIFITDDPNDNYIFTPDANLGTLTIEKKALSFAINDLVIEEGDVILSSDISLQSNPVGFVYGDTTFSVFGNTIPYYFVNAQGVSYIPGDTGIFFIQITEPSNYFIEYSTPAVIYINADGNDRKIRVYLDCVQENPGDPSGLYFIANYRYETRIMRWFIFRMDRLIK